MKLYDIQNNAIQVAIDTCIQNLYELRDLFESPHDLEDHSLWTLNLLYEYLTDEVVVIKDVMNDTEYPESYQEDYDAMIDGLNRIRSVMIKKLADGEELFHTDFKHLVELKMKYDGDEFPKIEFDADEYSILECALEQYQKNREYRDSHNDEFAKMTIGPIKDLRKKLEQYCEDCFDYVCDNIKKESE
tara:strand:- start:1681 stop:2244 length:564 start_codon:yes stop_codon:yes gene_type:complete